ncbi:Transcription factor GTE9 [Apostasia shenzhenica]|uniref:Transcription factor GTE9 n=1 Tax=Apostasia shenzhenica TaxID=1088818 RepID=A0A2I0AK19_9ASPA|nr:Transcription factor GTE9 [Apostasia shenzhenica]
MTQTGTKRCSWSQRKASDKLSDVLHSTLMGKTQFSTGHSSGFVPEFRHAVEAFGESEGFVSPGNVGSEGSCTPKRRCVSLNADRCDGFYVPMQVFSLLKMSTSERKDLQMRLQRDLEQVQMLQKKILSSTAMKSNGDAVSSYSDHLVKKQVFIDPQVKRGIAGRFKSMKQHPAAPSVALLMKQCETLIKRLMTHQHAWVFNTPVDVLKLNIPDYFTVIKQPMDLGTVRCKVASGAYPSPWDFASDVRLTFSNAMTYNPPGNDVHVMADMMSKFFEMRWKPIEKKLIAAEAATKRETDASMIASESWEKKVTQEDCCDLKLDSDLKMTEEEKLSLSRRLSSISEFPQQIVDFLKRHSDDANQHSEDEIEIDFSSLSNDTLFELKKLLDEHMEEHHSELLEKTEAAIEIPNASRLNGLSLRPCKDVGSIDVDEDVDIDGNYPPITSCSPVRRGKSTIPICSKDISSSCSSSESGSSTDSDSSSTSRSKSNHKVASSLNSTKDNEPTPPGACHGKSSYLDSVSRSESDTKAASPPNLTKENEPTQAATRCDKGPVSVVNQSELTAHLKADLVEANFSQEGENAPPERQVSPEKLYRAALLRNRFADTILKAREKTLDQGKKKDPEKLKREKEELERQQREEKARLQAEAKAAEEARRQAEAEAAAEARRRRELEREAARQALLQMEKTVEINESSLFLKDLEILRTAGEHIPGNAIEANLGCSNEDIGGFNLGGSNPLEKLGLYMKADDDDDEENEGDEPSSKPVNDAVIETD